MSINIMTTPSVKTSSAQSLITGEELAAMHNSELTELIKGEIAPLMPTGHPHSFYEGNITGFLFNFVRKHKLGRVLTGEVGIYTHRQPDSIRAADVAFISHQRLAQVQSTSFLDICPELIVEILSPTDSWSEVYEKIEEYFSVHAQLIWIIDPRRQRIHVYHSATNVTILTDKDMLTGSNILPGFEISVAELFT